MKYNSLYALRSLLLFQGTFIQRLAFQVPRHPKTGIIHGIVHALPKQHDTKLGDENHGINKFLLNAFQLLFRRAIVIVPWNVIVPTITAAKICSRRSRSRTKSEMCESCRRPTAIQIRHMKGPSISEDKCHHQHGEKCKTSGREKKHCYSCFRLLVRCDERIKWRRYLIIDRYDLSLVKSRMVSTSNVRSLFCADVTKECMLRQMLEYVSMCRWIGCWYSYQLSEALSVSISAYLLHCVMQWNTYCRFFRKCGKKYFTRVKYLLPHFPKKRQKVFHPHHSSFGTIEVNTVWYGSQEFFHTLCFQSKIVFT